METALAILKYLAICLAAASGIWAMLNKLTYDDESGRRRLTTAGRIAISIALAGVLIGIATGYLQNEISARSQRSAAISAAQREPLRALRIEWSFEQSPSTDLTRVAAADPCESEWLEREHGSRLHQMYPALSASPPHSSPSRSVLLVLPLDDAAANVLPLGMLALAAADNEDAIPQPMAKDQLLAMSATVDFREDLEECQDITEAYHRPAIARQRRCKLKTEVQRQGLQLTAIWELDSECVADGVDHTDPNREPTAQFPERMVLVVMTDVDTLPFSPANFAHTEQWLPWDLRLRPAKKRGQSSQLTLIPNGNATASITYDLWLQYARPMAGKSGGAAVKYDFPLVKVWVGERRPPER